MTTVNYNSPGEKRIQYIKRDKEIIDEIITRGNFKSKIENGFKECNKCKDMISVYEFGTFNDKKSNKRYLNSVCKKCASKRSSEWKKKNPEKWAAEKERMKGVIQKNKEIIYKAYGNKCNCCGEDNPLFLTIDHVNNDGFKIRPRNQNGESSGEFSGHYYKRIISAGFPDDLQLLCWNCNCGKARNNGVCPHKI